MRPDQGEVDGAAFMAMQRLAWTEKQFQAALLKAYCGTKKEPLPAGIAWKAFHTFFSKNSMEGWPDLVLLRGGRIVIAEMKSETGKLSAAQKECLALLRAVQLAIAASLCRASLECGDGNGPLSPRPACAFHIRIAERMYGVYEWRPRHWNSAEIESVLR